MTDAPTPNPATAYEPVPGCDRCRPDLPYECPKHRSMPPLPTNLDDWHATVRLHRNPGYLRAMADDYDRLRNGEQVAPDARSVDDLMAEFNDPTPQQLRKRVDNLRAESARLSALADEIEGRL